MNRIPFNRPHLTGKEIEYIRHAVESGKISGDGTYTKLCHQFFEKRFAFQKCLLTTSCTDALEMCAALLHISEGDEIIMPSYTFVSTANPFVMRGAKIKFADSRGDHPNINENEIEALITPRTRAIVVVHYAGVACNMDRIMQIAQTHKIDVVEDAAQAIDSFFNGKPLGSFGALGAMSFHETKNVNCGEGGLLIINNNVFNSRAEIVREKGTNRSAFFRGEVDKYNWIDVGSSHLPSDLNAAYLYAQLECMDDIQRRRKNIWNQYNSSLTGLNQNGLVGLPNLPAYATNNAHMYYLVCRSFEERGALINHLQSHGIQAVFHYLPLHKSPFYSGQYDGRPLINAEQFGDCLVRLPLYFSLTDAEVGFICDTITSFFD